MKTKKELDRENPPLVPYVIVYTTNACGNDPPIKQCSEIDTTQPQYLNVSIAVRKIRKPLMITIENKLLYNFNSPILL